MAIAPRLVKSANKIVARDIQPGMQPQSTLTLSGGVAVPVYGAHVIAAESGTTDNFDSVTLTNLRAGDVVEWTVDAGDRITFTNGVGNITTSTGASIIALAGQTVRTKVNAAGNGVVATLIDRQIHYIASLTALTAKSTANLTSGYMLYVAELSRGGLFVWDSSNLSTEVGYETAGNEGVYFAPDSDDTGASGAWVRQSYREGNSLNIDWFGALPDASSDSTDAVQACIDFTQASDRRPIRVPAARYQLDGSLSVPHGTAIEGSGFWSEERNYFGSADWDDAETDGSILEFTITSGVFIELGGDRDLNPSSFQYGGRFEKLLIMGPGTGTATAVKMKDALCWHYEQVAIANSYRGLWWDFVEESRFHTISFWGCVEGFLSDADEDDYGNNENSVYGFEANRCWYPITAINGEGNAFYKGLLQHTHQDAIRLTRDDVNDAANPLNILTMFAFYDFWVENGSTGQASEDPTNTRMNGVLFRISGDNNYGHTFDNFRLSNSISPSLTGGSDCGYHRFSNIIKVSGPAVNFTIPSTMPKCEVTRRKSVGFVDNSSTGDVQIRDDLTLTVTDLTGVASATVHAVKTGGTAHLRVIGATGTGASDIITISGLTETYRPRKNTGFFPVRVVDNNVYGFGMCRVTTAGLIEIYKDAAGASFGSSANTGFSTFDIDFATEVI